MSAVRARIAGLERLAPQARQMAATVGEAMTVVLLEGARAIAANARARVLALKDDSGPSVLAQSLRVEDTDTGAVVMADAAHAPYVEFGTRRAAAQPFLGPAMDEERPGIIERVGRTLALGDGA
jgi:HK97 gp10 family phage protein